MSIKFWEVLFYGAAIVITAVAVIYAAAGQLAIAITEFGLAVLIGIAAYFINKIYHNVV